MFGKRAEGKAAKPYRASKDNASSQANLPVPVEQEDPSPEARDLVVSDAGGSGDAGALAQQDGSTELRQQRGGKRRTATAAEAVERTLVYTNSELETETYLQAKRIIIESIIENADFDKLRHLEDEPKRAKISEITATYLKEIKTPLNAKQHELLKKQVVDEIIGFGPLEPLLVDPDISDIMINTHNVVYIEKFGKIHPTDVKFLSEQHLLNVVQKIISLVGRRVDEKSPMVDARMPDGSRFNAIIPPLALDGSLVSIRRFKKNKMPLSAYVQHNSMTSEMARFLEVCAHIRLNILISGGTGSGKTTLLNALSGHIDVGERVITIEDAAELKLHQPHVLRLETRPSNIEGEGEITQRQLVKNALRMRPDRIILGEIRADEVVDVLAAMNTGHEGSMATIHANSPRDSLSRIENLFGLAGLQLPIPALRQQIASALHLVVQLERMRDGMRRITHIEEVVGMEGDIITTQLLFGFKPQAVGQDGKIKGEYFTTGIRPHFYDQAIYYGRERELANALGISASGGGL